MNQVVAKISAQLTQMKSFWDGREAITELQKNNYHWRQMEWIGWYFQYLCTKYLEGIVDIPGPKFGRVEFDGFLEIPWDFKLHPETDSHGKVSTKVVVNDKQAILQAIDQFGSAGVILGLGVATFNDVDRSFQIWHKELKGGLSKYEIDRITRKAPSRLRKTDFTLGKINIYKLTRTDVTKGADFQTGFRNSDGSPRKTKLMLDTEIIKPVHSIMFLDSQA